MHGLSERFDRRFTKRAVMWSATAALAAGLLVPAVGCERSGEAGAPATAPVVAAPTAPVVAAPTGPLRIVFDPPELDFGTILPNVDKTGSISVRNEGDVAVKILQVKSTCKCTTLSDLAGSVIDPGGAVTLATALEGRALAGPRKAALKFTFEGYKDVLTFDIRAEVALPVRASPSIFNLAGGATSGHVVVESMDGRPFTILAAHRQPPRFVDFDPEIDEPRSSYMIEWDLGAELAENKLPHWWVIETDHPDCPLVDSWVRHLATIEKPLRARPWRMADRRVLLGVIKPGESEDFSVVVNKIGTDAIHTVRSLSPEFEAELLSFKRDGAEGDIDGLCTVRITPAAGHRGVYQGAVEFVASRYAHAIDVVGKVAP